MLDTETVFTIMGSENPGEFQHYRTRSWDMISAMVYTECLPVSPFFKIWFTQFFIVRRACLC